MVVAAGYWMLSTGGTPDYPVTFLPGLFAGGISAGLTQAPLFAAAATLPPDRATTGSAVLTMARQVGSAIGVAVVVVILGTAAVHPVGAFHHVWAAEAIAGLAACLAIAATAKSDRPPACVAGRGPIGREPGSTSSLRLDDQFQGLPVEGVGWAVAEATARRSGGGLSALVVKVAAGGQASGSTSGCVNRTGLPSDRA